MEANARRFFISYAHGAADDERLRSWLHDALTQAGHEVFFDGKIPFGTAWADEIERQLGLCDFLVILLSESSVRSEAVLEEIRRARERLRATGTPRFLTIRVNFAGALPYAWATYLGKYQWKSWSGDADSQPIFQAILDVAGGQWWVHVARFDGSTVKAVASRLLSFPFQAVRFADNAGTRLQLAVGPTGNSIQLLTIQPEVPEAEPIQGDPKQLLEEWQKKLGLRITEAGEIEAVR